MRATTQVIEQRNGDPHQKASSCFAMPYVSVHSGEKPERRIRQLWISVQLGAELASVGSVGEAPLYGELLSASYNIHGLATFSEHHL